MAGWFNCQLLRRMVQASYRSETLLSAGRLCSCSSITTTIRRAPFPSLQRRLYSQAPRQRSFPALFARGGTSNGLVIRRADLPADTCMWPGVLASSMGSPDPYGRQLDGIGSGISSTSKVVVVGPPSRPDVDVDFTFVQVGVRDGVLDMAGNCGNMSSLVGPAALEFGLVDKSVVARDQGEQAQEKELQHQQGQDWATVRFLNTNTNKLMSARFRVAGSPPRFCPHGDYEMDGVPGTHSRITMSFLDPAGAKTGRALPTGSPVDVLKLSDGSSVEVSLIDVGNPGVFVAAASLGLYGADTKTTPATVEANKALKTRLGEIRAAGAARMGLDPSVESVPKIVLLFPREEAKAAGVDIRCLALSMGQAHKAVPLTLALCLGAASQLKGTLAAGLIGGAVKETVTIGHPSGKVDIGTTIRDGKIESAQLLRTARFLMKGDVYY